MQGSSSGCWTAQTHRHTESSGSQGPWLGSAAPHTQRQTPWAPSKCMTDVGSLALSSPAQTCAGGWGLFLRVWVPAHGPNSGKQPLRQDLLEEPCSPVWLVSAQPAGKRAPTGKEVAAQPRQVESPACAEPSEPPVRQSSSSAQRPDLAEFLSRGCSAMGEPCPDLPCF